MKNKSKKFDAVKALRGDKIEPRAIKRSDGTKLGGEGDNLDALQERVIQQLTNEPDLSEKESDTPQQHVAVRRVDDQTNPPPKITTTASMQEVVESMLAEEECEELLDDDPCEYDSWTKEV